MMAIFSIFFAIILFPLALAFPSSSFSTQPKPNLSRPSLKGRFLQITDIHPDPYYKRGTLLKTSCHRRPRRSHKNPPKEGYSGHWGLPDSICDSPDTLVRATFKWIRKELKDRIDFVVWTGDNARHDTDNRIPRTEKEIEDQNVYVVRYFADIFGNLALTNSSYTLTRDDYILPIVPHIGNNDVYPHNIMKGGPRNPALLAFQRIWGAFIPEEQVHTFQEGGYYAVDVAHRLRVLALNTMYFYNSNAAVDGCHKQDEPGTDEMRWLEAQLQKAEKQNWKVIISGHVPPAKKSYSSSCHRIYASLGFRYKDTIVGHLFGHANIDHFFMISKDDTEKGQDDDNALEDEISLGQPDQIPLMVNHSNISNSAEVPLPHTNYSTLSGLNTYLETVLAQYEDLPGKGNCEDYFVVNVSPSVVPTYNPGLRVYEYELGEKNFGILRGYTQYWLNVTKWNEEAEKTVNQEKAGEPGKDEEEEEEELDFVFSEELNKKGDKKKKPKEPEEPDDPNDPEEPDLPPLPPLKPPTYEVEYTTWKDYGMEDLRSRNWCHLGRRIGKDDGKLKRKYLERAFVQTWDGELDKKYIY